MDLSVFWTAETEPADVLRSCGLTKFSSTYLEAETWTATALTRMGGSLAVTVTSSGYVSVL